METNLPPIEEVQATQYMQIVRICLNEYVQEHVTTKLYSVIDGKPAKQIETSLIEIDDDRIRGYIPSKIFVVGDSIQLLFYTSPSLPDGARPFGKGKTYVVLYFPRPDEVVEYDVDTRVLVDQLIIRDRLAYVFLFEEKKYKEMIFEPPTDAVLYTG